MTEAPIVEFKGMNVSSKKITVAVYADRVEVTSKNAWPSKKYDVTSIPIKSISAISSKGEGLAFQRVTFGSAGGSADIKLKRDDAEQLVSMLRSMSV